MGDYISSARTQFTHCGYGAELLVYSPQDIFASVAHTKTSPENLALYIAHYKMIFPLVACLALIPGISLGRPGGAAASHDPPGTGARRSVRDWVSCSGRSDDTAGLAKALQAAAHGAFTLIVDCPLNLKVGTDIEKTLFIDDGTTVEFIGAGKFTVDNVFIPAFVIADSSNITLVNWNVEYDASLPVNPNAPVYRGGISVRGAKPANAFNDLRLTSWLAANRGVVFDRSHGNVNSFWTGMTNTCAVFFITGDSGSIQVSGMHLYVPAGVGGERFIPVAFSLGTNIKRSQTVLAQAPMTSDAYAVPHDLSFSNIRLDGTYMGWVGGLRNATFQNIESLRYGDLQDATGDNVGGIKKWFAPPHLFYFSYSMTGDPALFSDNITIEHVVDKGLRAGRARDAGGSDSLSGYANSLKLGCTNCKVDDYSSERPDGLMDVLGSDGLSVSNVTGTYNSAFLNNLFPGWRFPAASYKNVTFENVALVDTATASIQPPIGNAGQPANEGIVFKNVHIELNQWAGHGNPLPVIGGPSNHVSIDAVVKGSSWHLAKMQKGSLDLVLQSAPSPSGLGATLTWTLHGADHCSASGALDGEIIGSGSTTLDTSRAPANDVTVACQRKADMSNAAVRVVVKP